MKLTNSEIGLLINFQKKSSQHINFKICENPFNPCQKKT